MALAVAVRWQRTRRRFPAVVNVGSQRYEAEFGGEYKSHHVHSVILHKDVRGTGGDGARQRRALLACSAPAFSDTRAWAWVAPGRELSGLEDEPVLLPIDPNKHMTLCQIGQIEIPRWMWSSMAMSIQAGPIVTARVWPRLGSRRGASAEDLRGYPEKMQVGSRSISVSRSSTRVEGASRS
jgi:hypothetical protein